MNLRQIIPNQKLSNFNYKLSDFISEQDKISSGEKTSTGIPKFWYKNKDGKTVSSTDQNAQDRGYEIATKEELPKEKQPKKVDTKGDEEEIKVDISDEEKEKINDFGEEIGLHPSDTDPDVFVDDNGNAVMTIGSDGTLLAVDEPGELSDKEAKDFEKRINDFNTGTDDVTTDDTTTDDIDDDDDDDDEIEEEKTDTAGGRLGKIALSAFSEGLDQVYGTTTTKPKVYPLATEKVEEEVTDLDSPDVVQDILDAPAGETPEEEKIRLEKEEEEKKKAEALKTTTT